MFSILKFNAYTLQNHYKINKNCMLHKKNDKIVCMFDKHNDKIKFVFLGFKLSNFKIERNFSSLFYTFK